MWAKYFKGLLNKGEEWEDQVNTIYCGPDPFIPGSVFEWTRQYLAYADDTVISSRNTDALNEVLYQLQMKAKSAGLDINHNKTKFMRNIKNYNNNTNKVILNSTPCEEVSYFKYLGSLVTYNNDIMVEIQDRIASGKLPMSP
jgi:Reverse transcriptase (RNA-dependent DNA polymerase).